jgi:murein DD-endopeptidase MepM/ murein hydrolase activator NlpD
VAVGSGKIVYSEQGHTPWGTKKNVGVDTPGSVLLELDKAIEVAGQKYKYAWYTHLSQLANDVKSGSVGKRVNQGDILGKTGLGNRNAHLHFGLITEAGKYTQAEGTTAEAFTLQDYLQGVVNAEGQKKVQPQTPIGGIDDLDRMNTKKEAQLRASKNIKNLEILNRANRAVPVSAPNVGDKSPVSFMPPGGMNGDIVAAIFAFADLMVNKADRLINVTDKNPGPDSGIMAV